MPTAIKPKRSTTVGQIPGLSDLQDGEMAINIVDQKIYIRSGNNIETVASAATGAVPVWTLLNTSGQMTVNKRYVIDTSAAELTFAMPTVGLSNLIIFIGTSLANGTHTKQLSLSTQGFKRILCVCFEERLGIYASSYKGEHCINHRNF